MSSTKFRATMITATLLTGALFLGVPSCTPSSGGTLGNAAGGTSGQEPPDDDRIAKEYGYKIVATYPHDKSSYTQGLLWDDGHLIETTGRERTSFIRRIKLETGKAVKSTQLPGMEFGEGVAKWKGIYIQLTWKNQQAIYWDAKTLRELYRIGYQGEGWGLTLAGDELVMSDGSNTLQFRDPKTFELKRKLEVKIWNYKLERYIPVPELNELEWIDGEIWANIYQDELIARIDPKTGYITSSIDLSGLQKKQNVRDLNQDVLNGIAHDPKTGRLFITGKHWPNLYVIEVVEK